VFEPAAAQVRLELLAHGTKPDREAGAAFLREFVEKAKASGFVAGLIEKHGVTGRLTVAPPA